MISLVFYLELKIAGKLQAKEWKDKEQWNKQRNNQERQSTSAGASDNCRHDNSKDRKANHKTTPLIPILNKYSTSIHPGNRIAILFA